MNQEKMGKLIAKLRKEKEMTQGELGDLLGVSGKSVSKWERGTSTPDISILNDLADILEIKLSDLLKGQKSSSQNENEIFDLDEYVKVGKIKKAEELKNKNHLKRNIMILVFVVFMIAIYNFLLISVTKKVIANEFYTVAFISKDPDYAISGKIISSDSKKFIILDKVFYQGEDCGTDKEVLIQSLSIFLKNEDEILFNSYFSEMTDYGEPILYKLSDVLEEVSPKVNEFERDAKIQLDDLCLEIIIMDKDGEIISKEISLEVIF